MPYCPICGYEYESYVPYCNDCKSELAEELPEFEIEEMEWVKLSPVRGTVLADMIKNLLEQNGIPCIVKKSFFGSAYGGMSTGLSGFESIVLVPKAQRGEAEQLMQSFFDDGE